MASPHTMMHPVLLSRITDEDFVWRNVTQLAKINEEVKSGGEPSQYRVRLSVIGFKSPMKSAEALKDCVYLYDSKTGSTRLASSSKSAAKSKTESYVFSLPLYVKDYTNMHSNKVNVVHIVDSSTEEEGDEFIPGFSPQGLLKGSKATL